MRVCNLKRKFVFTGLLWLGTCFMCLGSRSATASDAQGDSIASLYERWNNGVSVSQMARVSGLQPAVDAETKEAQRLLLEVEAAFAESGDIFHERRWEALALALQGIPENHRLHWHHTFYIGFYEVACGDVRRAALHAEQALGLAKKLNDPILRINSLWLLFALHKQMGDHDLALRYFESFYKEQRQYETKQRKASATVQAKSNRPIVRIGLVFWGLACLVLISFAAWFLVPYRMMLVPTQKGIAGSSVKPTVWLQEVKTPSKTDENVLTDEEILVDEHKVELLAQLRSQKIITQEDWEAFERLFLQIYPDFLIHLRFRHNAVTPAEEKLACLIRAHFSTKEIARMLAVSTHSVNVGRHRLKKRFALSMGNTLEEYLMRF